MDALPRCETFSTSLVSRSVVSQAPFDGFGTSERTAIATRLVSLAKGVLSDRHRRLLGVGSQRLGDRTQPELAQCALAP